MKNDNELYHYGVLGMKWGRRKNPQRAYEKASKKLSRLNNRVAAYRERVSKSVNRYNKSKHALFSFTTPEEAESQVVKSQYKYEKSLRKAKKWYDAMQRELSKSDIELSDKQIALGESYVKEIDKLDDIQVSRLYV